ncbi:MAG: hypothetical protein RIS44_739 [Pseudomonadota bacterium]|jgi:hypothetical protein
MSRVDPLHPYKTPTSAAAKVATAVVAALLALPLSWLLITTLQQLGALGRPLQPPDDTRMALWLSVSLLLLCWAPARRVGTSLVARFDSVMLRPPATVDAATLRASSNTCKQLRDWCFDGIGTGAAPMWLPNAIPAMDQPLSIAVWEMAPQPEQAAQQTQLNAFMSEIDGTGLLLACNGPWAGRWLRLRIKLREALWWRTRQKDDPWDCGFLNTHADAIDQLRLFLPRRATLIVVQNLPIDLLRNVLASLQERQAVFSHPVRVLLLDPAQIPELELAVHIDHNP